MNLAQLPYVISIAKTGSLSGASRELGVSQAALSRYLKELERKTGTPLFVTVKRKMHPTPAGLRYLRTAREMLGVLDSTYASIAQLGQPAAQKMRVGISPHSGARLLASIYVDFHHRFPSVEIVPTEGYANNLREALLREEIDLYFNSGEPHEALERFPISRAEIVLAAPAVQTLGLPSPDIPIDGLAPFRNSVFVLPNEHSSLYNYIQPLLAADDFQPQVVFTTPNVTMLHQMILSGAGIGFLPLYQAQAVPGLQIYHFKQPSYMTNSFFVRKGHRFTAAEHYLLFLWMRNGFSSPDFIRNPFNLDLLSEYAPEIAADWDKEGLE